MRRLIYDIVVYCRKFFYKRVIRRPRIHFCGEKGLASFKHIANKNILYELAQLKPFNKNKLKSKMINSLTKTYKTF